MRIHVIGNRLWVVRCFTVAFMAVLVGFFAVSGARADFGIKSFDVQVAADPIGNVFTQAGGHPYSFTTNIELNHHLDTDPADYLVVCCSAAGRGQVPDTGQPKDVGVDVTPGLIGNPSALAHCTGVQLAGEGGPPNGSGIGFQPICPLESQVGVVVIYFSISSAEGRAFPLFNMVAPPHAPARFGFQVEGTVVTLQANIRNGHDFGVTVLSHDIPEALFLWGAEVTFWGVPADPSHDNQRCEAGMTYEKPFVCGPNSVSVQPRAFLTMPTSCTPPGTGDEFRAFVDLWNDPGVFASATAFTHLAPFFGEEGAPGPQEGMTDCGRVPFDPSISVQPTNHEADTPTGLDIEISLPQEGLLNPSGIATSDVKKAVVELPAGESISPSAADGLGACSLDQIGLETGEPERCPDSSKLGTVEIETPLLEKPLTGSIFLGKPECGPCGVADDLSGRLVKIYIVAEGSGTIIKLPGRVELDPVTGRILSVFDNNPQLPFSHLHVNFKAGPRSPIVNPHTCGSFETRAQFTPWSGNPPANVGDSFQITTGPEGKPCPTSTTQAFNPSFIAGTVNNQAGAFTPMQVTFSRGDGEQQLGGVSFNMAPGVLGSLTGLPLCGEPQASEGTCGPESQIGTLSVAAGAGANPFYVTGGKVFLTTGYKTGSFGVSIVVPAVAGPFDLGTVVVRGAVNVDPHTAALNVTTDPLPTILDGIPLDLRVVNVMVNRPGFVFNPTNCDPMKLSGLLTGGLGSVAPFDERFQVTNCAALGFKPKFKVSTNGRTSRAGGASLTATLSYPKAPWGTQANVARVKVELPKALPSRLETLQKACTSQVFESDPAACPQASKIGTATATTPLLPVGLSGPVYFVSHGGVAWPDLVIVLQGYGVTVQIVGTTFINEKTGITSTTFKTIPDVPVGTFQLKLPQGRFSALAANSNLCTTTLRMPTEFVSQNGIRVHQNTPITPTGCSRHKAHHKHHKHKHKKK